MGFGPAVAKAAQFNKPVHLNTSPPVAVVTSDGKTAQKAASDTHKVPKENCCQIWCANGLTATDPPGTLDRDGGESICKNVPTSAITQAAK